MAIDTRYASVAELKDALGITDNDDDRRLGNVLNGSSRAIDKWCGQRFYTTSSDETRYYTSEHGDEFYPPDPIVSITTFKSDSDGDRTYATTFATTDYDLMPFNAATDNEPYTWLEVTPTGDYSFDTIAKGIQIVGKFGWPAVPDEIREATLLLAERVFKRKDAVFGIIGVSELGVVQKVTNVLKDDGELLMMLAPFKRHV